MDPSTGEVFARSPLNTVEEFRQAVEAARKAQPAWAALPPKERARILLRIRDYLVAHADDLADVIARDNGKTRMDGLMTEVLLAAIALTYYVRMAPRFLKPQKLSPASIVLANKRATVVRVPWGVVAMLSPWNYPFAIPFHEIVPATPHGMGRRRSTSVPTSPSAR